MMTELKKEGRYSWDAAGQIFSDGQMIAQVSLNVPPDRREFAASEIAAGLARIEAEPSAQPAAPADGIEQRSLDSIIGQVGAALFPDLIGCHPDGEAWRLARVRARLAIQVILGPLAHMLVDAAWQGGWTSCDRGDSRPDPHPENVEDCILCVLGPPGLEYAWPAGDVPSMGEIGELAIWLVGNAAATDRAWIEQGMDQQQPQQYAFMCELMRRQRLAADYLRRIGLALHQQARPALAPVPDPAG